MVFKFQDVQRSRLPPVWWLRCFASLDPWDLSYGSRRRLGEAEGEAGDLSGAVAALGHPWLLVQPLKAWTGTDWDM